MMSSLHLDPESIERDPDHDAFGPDTLIPLNTGSPSFGVPAPVRAGVKRSVDVTEQLSYPPTCGGRALQLAIASFQRTHLGLDHAPDQLLVTYGAMQAVYDTIAALTRGPRKEVLLPTPQWFQFPHVVTQAGATASCVPTDASIGFKLTPERLADAITPQSRVLVLTNPGNPVGSEYTRAELEALAEVICRHPELMVISDEVYNLLRIGASHRLAPTTSLASIESIAGQVYTVNSLSKNQAMSGLRVGYVAAPSVPLRNELCGVQRFTSLGVNVYLQEGALAAYANTAAIVLPINRALQERLALANVEMARELPRLRYVPPELGYYLWTEVGDYLGRYTPGGERIDTDVQLCSYLEREARVAVVPGTPCGTPGYFRLTFAIHQDLFRRGVARMAEYLGRLRGDY